MNIEILKEGQKYKNYKELCKTLDVKIQSGASKKAQLKELSCYCDYMKVGHSFVIKEIYDNPKVKYDGRGKKSLYGDMVQFLIADLLVRTEVKHLSISKNQLLLAVNMINENYGFCSKRIKALSEYTSIAPYVIHDFYNTSNSNFRSAIETALKNLYNKRLIWYKDIIKVCTGRGLHKEATIEQLDQINRYEHKALKDFPCETVTEIRKTKYWSEFKDKVREYLNQNTNISYYYQAYFISIEEEYLKNERDKLLEYMLDEHHKKELKSKLNDTVVNNFIKNANTRYDNALNGSAKMVSYRFDVEYPKKIKLLIEMLINTNYEDISQTINEISDKIDEDVKTQLDSLDLMFG